MGSADRAMRRPKRKRSRKVRTAIVSSDESSDSDTTSQAASARAASPSSSSASSVSSDDDDDTSLSQSEQARHSNDQFDEDDPAHDAMELDDPDAKHNTLLPPNLVFPGQAESSSASHYKRKAPMERRISTMSSEDISKELAEKQRKAFHALYMQALTDDFENDLDHIRQHDPRLMEDASTSRATGRMTLLVDALSFGSEAFTHAQASSHQVALALPTNQTES